MQTPLLTHEKERISVDEYYQLRHKLLSLRRQYAQAVYGNDRYALPTERIKRLERRVASLERRLAYADIDLPYEPLTIHELGTELWERLSNINLRQYANRVKQRKPLEA